MARRAATRTVEVPPSGLSIPGLQILDVHGATASAERLGLHLRVVDERDHRRDIGVAQIRRGHALVRAPLTNDRTDLVAAHVLGNERRPGEIGPCFSSSGVPAVTEAALGDEACLAGLESVPEDRSAASLLQEVSSTQGSRPRRDPEPQPDAGVSSHAHTKGRANSVAVIWNTLSAERSRRGAHWQWSAVLGIDVGTSGSRVVIVDQDGRVVASATTEHAPFASPQTAWAEQEPEDWWRASREAIRAALKTSASGAQLDSRDRSLRSDARQRAAGRGRSGRPAGHHLVRSANRSRMPMAHRNDRRRAAALD